MAMKSSPQREKTTLNLPKTATLFYSLRRQPNRNISALTQSSQANGRNFSNVSESSAVVLDSDYGRTIDIQLLETSQRPSVKSTIESRKMSEVSRTKQLFKTLEQTLQNRPNLSQLERSDNRSLEAVPCSTCQNNKKKIQSMTREIDELQDIISGMLKDQSSLSLDLKKAKIVLRDTKVAKDNQSIKRSHATENLELKVKLLQDSLTQRNHQLLEQEKQNQTLIQILDQYETKLELLNEKLIAKEITYSENQLDSTQIQEVISFHEEKLLKLKQLKLKHQRTEIQEDSTQVQMICYQSQVSIDQSNYRQSQKSINESNYSSEPLLENVKFN